MHLHREVVSTMGQGETAGNFELTVVVREVTDEDITYYVAECIELPGCVSDGDTPEQAKVNVEQAISLCLSVVFEDAVKQLTADKPMPDLRNIVRQDRLRLNTTPDLQYA